VGWVELEQSLATLGQSENCLRLRILALTAEVAEEKAVVHTQRTRLKVVAAAVGMQ
jgi:hypothetical protein